MKKILSLCASLFIFIACNSDSENSMSDDIDEITASIPSSEREPCDYISEAMIREIFSVENTTEITKSDQYGVCSFTWDGLSEAARKVADEEMQNTMIAAVTSGKMPDMKALQKGQFSVSLNFTNAKVTTSAQAASTYDAINKRMSEGVTVSADQVKEQTKGKNISDKAVDDVVGEGITFKGGTRTDIDGVGNAATWDDKLKQLTVLSGTDIFFVTVNAGGDEALAKRKSEEMAKEIINNL